MKSELRILVSNEIETRFSLETRHSKPRGGMHSEEKVESSHTQYNGHTYSFTLAPNYYEGLQNNFYLCRITFVKNLEKL